MTTQFDFTDTEWRDIAALPVLIGYAVALAEESGRVGSYIEARTLVQAIGAKAPANDATALIQAVSLTDVRDQVAHFEEHSPDLLADIAVTAATEIAKIIDRQATEAESIAFKEWVLAVGQQVAEAATEGGVRVSDGEIALLDRLRLALLP